MKSVFLFADVETSSKDESVLVTTVETGNSYQVKVMLFFLRKDA